MKRVRVAVAEGTALALAQAYETAARERGLAPVDDDVQLAVALSAYYPALRGAILSRPDDIVAIGHGGLRVARDLRTLRSLARAEVSDLSDLSLVQRGLRRFAHRERLRVAARELLPGAELDTTAREVSYIAQACIEIATEEALGWARARFGEPRTHAGATCAFSVLGMGKLGGRELNVGSDVDLLPFYETDEGEVVDSAGAVVDQTLHEHFTRVTQRLTATLEEQTEDGVVWRVDLRLRPEGSRGPLVNALAAAERYYETWGRTWERAALLRARPVAGDLAFGDRLLAALSPFVWRKVVDPRLARDLTELASRARAELSSSPERDLKLGVGGIREAEFFVQTLQLVWGGREPSLRVANTLEALRRLRSRGLVTDRESRELESGYLTLRRLEHRVQNATGLQTHVLPRGELLETIAKSLGYGAGKELEKDLDKTRRRVAARFSSLTKDVEPGAGELDRALVPLLAAIDSGADAAVIAALAEPASGIDFSSSVSADLARHLVALARRPDDPLGEASRDKHPALAHALLEALADAADPEQAARLLAALFGRLSTPAVYVRAVAADRRMLRKVVGLLGASALFGESLVYHPELVESLLFTKDPPSEERVRAEFEDEVAGATHPERLRRSDADPEEVFVGALRRLKARLTMEVGLADLAGELSPQKTRDVLTAIADASLDHAMRWALAEKGIVGGLTVVAMGKLGGRELGYGSDLDIFFVYEPPPDTSDDDDDAWSVRYVRAAQRAMRLLSAPHGDGPGYELDTRLRPSGSQGLLVVSLEGFMRYHGLTPREGPASEAPREGQDWERQALVKARPCAGDVALGARVQAAAARVAYERGAPDPARVHHLRMRMETELAREGPTRIDIKVGRGGMVDVEFAVQWLQMKHGREARVRTTETTAAIAALEVAGHLEPSAAAVLRESYLTLLRLDQALRVVHGTSASLLEHGAPGLAALARKMGFRDGPMPPAQALLEHVRALTRDVRAVYLEVLGVAAARPTGS